jgi:demethylspheroidene O-methyltransferase
MTSNAACRPSKALPLWRRQLTRWRQAWHRYRNSLLSRRKFHHQIARIPVLRGIAGRRASQLHNITAGFVYSQVLLACVELEIFEQLRDGPLHPEDFHRGAVGEQGLLRLLLAAHSLGLLESYADHTWGLSELSAAMLANPGIAAMVRHHRHLYADLAEPLQLLTARAPTQLSNYWPYALQENTSAVDAYTALMTESQDMIAEYILDAGPLEGAEYLVDIAGGAGRFASHALARYPALRATVIDLPEVVTGPAADKARAKSARLEFLAGDMFSGDLPTDASVISYVRVLHDHDDEPAQALIQRAFDALPPGGRLVVAEPLAGTPGAEPIGDAYFGLYLWAMGSGRPRHAAEYQQMFKNVGFTSVTELKSGMPCLVRILCAEKTVILS